MFVTPEELLAGRELTYDIAIPPEVLHPSPDGGVAVVGPAKEVRLRPLTVRDVQLIARAARDDEVLTSVLMIQLLGLPLLGGWAPFAGVIALIIFASLGLGLLISILSDSERQAVQLSMLVLLASVFFSGLVLPAEEFLPQVRWFAYALPVTHGIRLLQDIMLRGGTNAAWEIWALAGIGVTLFALTGLRMRALMARG